VGEVCNEIVCVEKFKNLEKDIDQLKTQQEKLEERLTSNEKQVSQIDNQLSIKLIQLEAKLDVHTKIVGEKVDNLAKEVEKKMDEYFKPNNSKSSLSAPTTDTFRDWVFKLGMKLLEYSVYGGFLYAVAKGLKLF
jgi:chromosome segregation ATPase